MDKPSTRDDSLLKDFATIFAHLWYRDFPIQQSLHEKGQRADWTTHIGIAVRSTADLMGLFTCFESGGRTDAILRDTTKAVAALEWEWSALHRGDIVVNEFEKLMEHCRKNTFLFAVLIGYVRSPAGKDKSPAGKDKLDYATLSAEVFEKYTKSWGKQLCPLLLIAIHFESIGKDEKRQTRQFTKMTIEKITNGERTLLREQPANPWDVVGSRWAKETKA